MKYKNLICSIALFILLETSLSAVVRTREPSALKILRKAYPDVLFVSEYDYEVRDWKITVVTSERTAVLYWASRKMLPLEKLSEKDKYVSFFYEYDGEIIDPANFTDEECKRIQEKTSKEARQARINASFIFDVIYESDTRKNVEKHIKRVSFLGKRSYIHEKIEAPLMEVEKDILEAAETDPEVKEFVDKLLSADSYNWREISDSKNRSMHSMGIAVDILPKGWGQKNLYWSWRRDIDPENWMRLPLERRWMPPLSVRRIFENHGFIWGGNWLIWDNMHFEYRPELLIKK